jgi:hypothetical protein
MFCNFADFYSLKLSILHIGHYFIILIFRRKSSQRTEDEIPLEAAMKKLEAWV